MTSARRLVISLVVGASLALPASASGAGGTYEVIQCAVENRGEEASAHQALAYSLERGCAQGPDNSMRIHSLLPANTGARGRYTWTAPPGTGFVGVRAQAKLRRHIGHRAHLVMADAEGNDTYRVGTGGTASTPFRTWSWRGPLQRRFIARLRCWASDGCDQSDRAKVRIRDVRLTLADLEDPEVGVSGSVLAGGWRTGLHSVGADLSDAGSGLARAVLRINEDVYRVVELDCAEIGETGAARLLKPCVDTHLMRPLQLSTAQAPFHDGANELTVCGYDFADNASCVTRTVRVDNSAPELALAAPRPDDPELIRAHVDDPHSGVASGRILFRPRGEGDWQALPTQIVPGELRARVDSAAHPPGPYELKAEAIDAAGNHAETTRREDGWPMVVTFPLRASVRMNTWIEPGGQRTTRLPYGRARRAAGRLVTAAGAPLPGREIRVEERFSSGALIDRRVRKVTTDANGRWRSRLPPGPSRRVRAGFDGDSRYLGREERVGRLAVKSRAGFVTSRRWLRQGRRITFGGRVARRGARIPNGGKLLELQVREGPRRWSTVREAFRSNPRGRYRFRYRFGRFYTRNVRFRFRVKVVRESGWPYRQAASRSRRVTIVAR